LNRDENAGINLMKYAQNTVGMTGINASGDDVRLEEIQAVVSEGRSYKSLDL
jgi:hypothetical protein